MRRIFSLATVFMLAAPIACGGESFDVGAVEDTHDEETSAEVGPIDDAAKGDDATPDSAAPSDAGETTDTSDAGPETCTPNECGGCTTLPAGVGDACGACGDGKWACADKESLKCEGARAANACGGCATLSAAPGSACGACGDGAMACDGTDAVKCSGARALNACGGCATLANPPGKACGVCGGGAFACSGTDATTCSDPVSTPPPGTTCGTCGTQKFACASDGKSTFCPKLDDRNVCGGCGTVSELPGFACGMCGVTTCTADKSGTFCKEATTPVGTTCGTCSKSKFVCSSVGTTSCERTDDRELRTWGPTDTTIATEEFAYPRNAPGVELKVAKGGQLTSVSLAIRRGEYLCPAVFSLPHPDSRCGSCARRIDGSYLCTVTSPVVGNLRVNLYKTVPITLGSPAATVTLAANDVTLSTPGLAWVKFDLPTPLAVTMGESIYVELVSDSSTYWFAWHRAPKITGALTKTWWHTPGYNDWGTASEQARPVKFESNTCDY